MSYLDVFKVRLPSYNHAVARGDIVKLGANAGPLYQVMAVRGERAWVRDPSRGSDAIVPVHRCRRVGRATSDTLS